MGEALFPMSRSWDWGTFILYCLVALIVATLCKNGARKNASNLNVTRKRRLHLSAYHFVAIIILALLGALRTYEVGPDTIYYVNEFKSATSFSFDWSILLGFHQIEPGFQLFIFLVRKITSNYTVFLFIVYFLLGWAYVSFFAYFFDEKSDYKFMQIFIYFFVSNMSGMRSALGTIFLLFSFIMLDKKKYFKATILTICATLFHYTLFFNILAIFVTWLMGKRALRKKRSLWITMLIAALLLAYTSIYWLKQLFANTKYNHYASVELSELSLLGSIFIITYGVLCLIFYRKLIAKFITTSIGEGNFYSTLTLIVMYPIIYVISAYRIPNYYALPRLFIWDEMTGLAKSYIKKDIGHRFLFNCLLQIIIWLYLLFRFTRTAEYGFFEYKWIFFS